MNPTSRKLPATKAARTEEAKPAVERNGRGPGGRSLNSSAVINALLAAGADMDASAISEVTGIAKKTLSRTLPYMAERGIITRKSVPGLVSNLVYLLTKEQEAASQQRGFNSKIADNTWVVLRALSTSYGQTVAELSKQTGLSGKELCWRLSRLAEKGVISRSERVDPEALRYFYCLGDEQRTAALGHPGVAPELKESNAPNSLLIEQAQTEVDNLNAARDEQTAQLKALHGKKASLHRQIDLIRKEREALLREIAYLELEVSDNQRQRASASLRREAISSQCGKVLAEAAMNPMTLSERLAFIRRLRARPALEPIAALRDIEADYQHALMISRK